MIVEDQGGALEVAVGQRFLDPGLALPEPVEHVEHLVAGDGPETERTPRLLPVVSGDSPRAVASLAMDEAGMRAARARTRLAAGLAVEDAGKAELGGQAEQGGDMAMGQRPLESDGLVEGGEDNAALEDGADGVDHGLGNFGGLARVLRRMRLPSRQVFLSRTAGGLERLGMTWTRMDMGGRHYMAVDDQDIVIISYIDTTPFIYMATAIPSERPRPDGYA